MCGSLHRNSKQRLQELRNFLIPYCDLHMSKTANSSIFSKWQKKKKNFKKFWIHKSEREILHSIRFLIKGTPFHYPTWEPTASTKYPHLIRFAAIIFAFFFLWHCFFPDLGESKPWWLFSIGDFLIVWPIHFHFLCFSLCCYGFLDGNVLEIHVVDGFDFIQQSWFHKNIERCNHGSSGYLCVSSYWLQSFEFLNLSIDGIYYKSNLYEWQIIHIV